MNADGARKRTKQAILDAIDTQICEATKAQKYWVKIKGCYGPEITTNIESRGFRVVEFSDSIEIYWN